MRWIKRISLILVFTLCGIALIILIWAIWERSRDPLSAIDPGISDFVILQDSVYHDAIISVNRTYHDITFFSLTTDTARIVLSLPDSVDGEKLPVMIIMGGLEIGRESLAYITNPGKNILIIYQYPYHPRYWYDGAAITQIPKIRNAVLIVPAQVVELLKWTHMQTWSDTSRISILGYSFGALFVPAVYHLAYSRKFVPAPGVIAYGGADVFRLLNTNLKNINQPWRYLVAWLSATAIYSADPMHHCPYLHGEFLLINGSQDHQIPQYCWKKLHDLTPEPKTEIILDEGHMHFRKPELTRRLVKMSQKWLLERGVINK